MTPLCSGTEERTFQLNRSFYSILVAFGVLIPTRLSRWEPGGEEKPTASFLAGGGRRWGKQCPPNGAVLRQWAEWFFPPPRAVPAVAPGAGGGGGSFSGGSPLGAVLPFSRFPAEAAPCSLLREQQGARQPEACPAPRRAAGARRVGWGGLRGVPSPLWGEAPPGGVGTKGCTNWEGKPASLTVKLGAKCRVSRGGKHLRDRTGGTCHLQRGGDPMVGGE